MKITVEIKGIEKLVYEIRKLQSDVRKKVEKLIVQAGVKTQKGARMRVPVRTGALRNSIQMSKYANIVKVGAYMPYASFVEYGTRKMKARPYLTPSYEEALKELNQELKRVVGDIK